MQIQMLCPPSKVRIVLALLLLTSLTTLEGNSLFLDRVFSYEGDDSRTDDIKVTKNIQFAEGAINRDANGDPSGDTMKLYLDVYEPIGSDLPEKRPAAIFIFGGGFKKGMKHHPTIKNFCVGFAERGYVTFSIQYRLGVRTIDRRGNIKGDFPPYEPGLAPKKPVPPPKLPFTDKEEFEAQQKADLNYAVQAAVHDAAKAIRWVRENSETYNIDPDRIVLGGTSAGAGTTLFTAYQEADTLGENTEVAAIIEVAGGLYGYEY